MMNKLILAFCLIMTPIISSAMNEDSNIVVSEKTNPGSWPENECIKLSKASGFYLKISADLLKESGEERDKGNSRRADELGSASLYFSNQAANYSENYRAYCK
jgi:hypothetical protein